MMAPLARRVAAPGLALLAAVGMHAALARLAAQSDPIAAVVMRGGIGTAAVLAGLVVVRLFLIFVLPVWIAHLIVSGIVAAVGERAGRQLRRSFPGLPKL
jgi:hypothetical protein